MTDRNDKPPKGARGQTAKRLKLKMPWDDWFDLSPQERAQEESAFLDYLETIYSGEDFRERSLGKDFQRSPVLPSD